MAWAGSWKESEPEVLELVRREGIEPPTNAV